MQDYLLISSRSWPPRPPALAVGWGARLTGETAAHASGVYSGICVRHAIIRLGNPYLRTRRLSAWKALRGTIPSLISSSIWYSSVHPAFVSWGYWRPAPASLQSLSCAIQHVPAWIPQRRRRLLAYLFLSGYAVYAVYAISSPDTRVPLRRRTAGSSRRPSRLRAPSPPFSLVCYKASAPPASACS